MGKSYSIVGLLLTGVVVLAVVLYLPTTSGSDSRAPYAYWWAADSGKTLAGTSDYPNSDGSFRLINDAGELDTTGHPFFSSLGPNGRACVTCHQPANGMSLSADTVRAVWEATRGEDPLFATVDGANCPHLPRGEEASHSLLLERGLIRIAVPWPPKGVTPDFTIEVVRDPTGCNTHPVYGLNGENPHISVYRRPRPVINLRHLTALPNGVAPHDKFLYNDKSLLPKDPETGKFVSLQLMSDGSGLTLRNQARDAARRHLELARDLTEDELVAIVDLEERLYGAQGIDVFGNDLDAAGAPPGLGPRVLVTGPAGYLGNNAINRVFGDFSMWGSPDAHPEGLGEEERLWRESVARGARVFFERRFLIQDVAGLTDKGLGNPFHRSCASGCHNTTLMGMDLAPGFMDLGLNNLPWANNRPDLPLFRIVCDKDAAPHSYLGREIYSHDPGRALVTGKCAHVGFTMTQQMRALSARAPYFANGSAATLRELVDFYDRRFNIGYTDQEKQDLINFLSVL